MGNNFLLFTINQSQMKLNLILLILELTSMDPTIKLQVKYREGKLSSKHSCSPKSIGIGYAIEFQVSKQHPPLQYLLLQLFLSTY